MENQSFFANENAWKIRKYVLLSGFLNFFYENGGANCKEFFAVDTFAMHSQLGDGRPRIPSLTRAARGPAKKSETTSVKLIRLLQQPNHLQAGIRTGNDIADLCSRDPNLIAEAEGPLENVFARIMATIRNRPAMLFIDPYGRSRLSFSSLKRVLRRKQSFTELVIKFDAEAVWRQAIELCADQCGHSIRCRAMFHKIGKVLGIDQLTEVPAAGPAAALIRNYVSEIARYGFFVGVHKITDELDLPMSYHLIYCTRTREHMMVMNNLVRTAEDHILVEYIKEKGIEPSRASLERDVDLRRLELKYLIREYLTKWGSRSINAAKWQIVFDRFGEFHENDFIQALDLADTKHLAG